MVYYVTLRNDLGQPSWSQYNTKEAFDEFYDGIMKDGSDEPIKTAYPDILYEGEDMKECQKVLDKDVSDMLSDNERYGEHLLVSLIKASQ